MARSEGASACAPAVAAGRSASVSSVAAATTPNLATRRTQMPEGTAACAAVARASHMGVTLDPHHVRGAQLVHHLGEVACPAFGAVSAEHAAADGIERRNGGGILSVDPH